MNAKRYSPTAARKENGLRKTCRNHKMYSDAKKNGQKIYFMQDVIVLPTSLKNSRSDIQSSGKIDIRKAETQKVMDYMYDEMFYRLL